MTDEFIGGSTVTTAPSNVPAAPETAPQSGTAPNSGLKTLHQDQIDSIARDAHSRGYSKAVKEFANSQSVNNQPVNEPVNLSSEELQRRIDEGIAKAQMQQSADLFVRQFETKMQQGAAKYPDFAQKVNNLDFSRMVDLVQMSSGLDNTADVMYDLANNPYKIASLQQLAQMQPHLAQLEMQKLSQSIKANQSPPPPPVNPPLGQITNSPIGTSNDSLPDLDYFSRRYRG